MTFLLETIKLGLANLGLNLLRSILTALGIIFGVAAVITMVGIGEGKTAQALERIERLGATNIIIRSEPPAEAQNEQRSFVNVYGLTYADLRVVENRFAHAANIVPSKEVGSELLRNELRRPSQSYGTVPAMVDVAGLRIESGRYLNDADIEQDTLVAVVGHRIAQEMFPLEDPLGKTLRIDEKSFKVVGVLAPVGLSGGAGSALIGRDLNQDVHIPISTARSVFGDVVVRRQSGSFSGSQVEVAEIYLQSADRESVLQDASLLRRLLESRRPGLTDVSIIVPYELLENARKSAMTWNLVLGAVAGISLLVGGIGIMNIMLATVTERTREIGIRRALGATRWHVVSQFLVETGVLSVIGGLIGVALGIGLALTLDSVVPMLPEVAVIGEYVPPDVELPTLVSPWAVGVAFIIATLTGLVFGIYPALKASTQDPIVALRHD